MFEGNPGDVLGSNKIEDNSEVILCTKFRRRFACSLAPTYAIRDGLRRILASTLRKFWYSVA